MTAACLAQLHEHIQHAQVAAARQLLPRVGCRHVVLVQVALPPAEPAPAIAPVSSAHGCVSVASCMCCWPIEHTLAATALPGSACDANVKVSSSLHLHAARLNCPIMGCLCLQVLSSAELILTGVYFSTPALGRRRREGLRTPCSMLCVPVRGHLMLVVLGQLLLHICLKAWQQEGPQHAVQALHGGPVDC